VFVRLRYFSGLVFENSRARVRLTAPGRRWRQNEGDANATVDSSSVNRGKRVRFIINGWCRDAGTVPPYQDRPEAGEEHAGPCPASGPDESRLHGARVASVVLLLQTNCLNLDEFPAALKPPNRQVGVSLEFQ